MDGRFYYLDPSGTYTEEQISENVKKQAHQIILIKDLYELKEKNPQIAFDTEYQWNTKSNEELRQIYLELKQSLD